MKPPCVRLFTCCLTALAVTFCSTAAAQEGSTRPPQQLETLKGQIRSARQELAMEHERAQQLQTRLACTETLLQAYGACGQEHEADSPDYWDCVQAALAGEDECRSLGAQSTGP